MSAQSSGYTVAYESQPQMSAPRPTPFTPQLRPRAFNNRPPFRPGMYPRSSYGAFSRAQQPGARIVQIQGRPVCSTHARYGGRAYNCDPDCCFYFDFVRLQMASSSNTTSVRPNCPMSSDQMANTTSLTGTNSPRMILPRPPQANAVQQFQPADLNWNGERNSG